MTGRMLLKNTIEAYTDYYLQYKLNQVVQEHRLVSLITLLRGMLQLVQRSPDPVCVFLKKIMKYYFKRANSRGELINIILTL